MSEITFNPGAWDDGARRVADTAQSFLSTAQGVLSTCTDLGRAGCTNGGTLADTALAMIFPALFQAVRETVDGLAEGLGGEAENMMATGANYRSIEDANRTIASSIGGE